MASHVFSELFIHANWHTDHDRPVLTAEVERFLHHYLRERCGQTKGVYLKGLGGTETHVHLAAQVEPSVLVSDLVGDLKGASAHEVNAHFGRKLLLWQRGYGVVSFSKKHLAWVLGYVAKQREHHATGRIVRILETGEADDPGSPAEAGSVEEEETPYTTT